MTIYIVCTASYYDKTFIYDSWSCRKNKGTHKSALRFHEKLEVMNRNGGEVWILKYSWNNEDRKYLNLLRNVLY
ncbi:hypothetical protein KJ785_04325 [Patescibacteria group bacterium]|nr:hypothetical protein [Patescibacteria group bacterium]